MSTAKINHDVLIIFDIPFDAAAFKATFYCLELPMNISPKLVQAAAASATAEITERMGVTVWQEATALKRTQVLISENLVLRKGEAEQICLILRVSPAVHMYVKKNGLIEELFFLSL